MGFIDKIKGIVNPDMEDYDDSEFNDDDYGYEEADTPTQNIPGGSSYGQQKQRSVVSGGVSANLELKVLKPDRYDKQTAQNAANHLLEGRTVVLNLENTQKESARRLIDFLGGVVYSIQGSIQRVANNTIVIVPSGVSVSGEQLREVKTQEDVDLF